MKVKVLATIHGKKPTGMSDVLVKKILGSALRATKYNQADIGVAFVDKQKMIGLNKVYHGKKGATDVLSFAYQDKKDQAIFGDIIICPGYVRDNIPDKNILRQEWCRLLVHGVLHLGGFDHATDRQEKRMFAIQEKLVKNLC